MHNLSSLIGVAPQLVSATLPHQPIICNLLTFSDHLRWWKLDTGLSCASTVEVKLQTFTLWELWSRENVSLKSFPTFFLAAARASQHPNGWREWSETKCHIFCHCCHSRRDIKSIFLPIFTLFFFSLSPKRLLAGALTNNLPNGKAALGPSAKCKRMI